jgi:hypothetical protein
MGDDTGIMTCLLEPNYMLDECGGGLREFLYPFFKTEFKYLV